MNQPLQVTISKTADGQHDYMQIISADQFAINVVLISQKITVNDVRPPAPDPRLRKAK